MKKIILATVLGTMLITPTTSVLAVPTAATAAVIAASAAANSNRNKDEESQEQELQTYDHKFHCSPEPVRMFKGLGRMTFEESFETAKATCKKDMEKLGISGKYESFAIRYVRNDGYVFLMRFSIDGYEN